jgi:hypothetical protein
MAHLIRSMIWLLAAGIPWHADTLRINAADNGREAPPLPGRGGVASDKRAARRARKSR